MTDLLQRAAGRGGSTAGDRTDRLVVLWACALSAAIALAGLIVGFALAILAWLAGSQGSTSDAFRAGAVTWLVSNGSAVTVSGAVVTAVPLGLVLLLAVAFFTLSRRFGAAAAVTSVREVLGFAATAGASYAVLLAGVASLSATEQVQVGPVRAAAVGFALAAVFAGLGVARQSGLLLTGWTDLPARVRAGARGAGYAIAAVLGVALVLFVVMLVAGISTFGRLWSGLDTGIVGGAGLALLCLVLAPNLVLWGAAVLLGPGVSVGTGTAVTLTGVSVGRLPALPVLAALPAPGPQPEWVIALAAVPVLAGIVAGYTACVRAPGDGWLESTGLGAAAGAAAGLVCGVLVALSAGSIGPGRMADAGPNPLLSFGAAAVALGVGGAVGGALGHYRVARADLRSE